ncbi:unnamed protein product [Pieris brassicae]|uniref:Uncharacterized protein n=1 Tax=Pieris brassicae TaxID=7116 RepID=A0A9P0SHH0_PIEBR|nr:unnamed protein product [Pieris brassicae]
MKVPDVNRCCFCIPLRPGIIIFAYLNVVFLAAAVTCLVISTELQKTSITRDSAVEVLTSTILYSILGMGLILNILLFVAAYQKDISMLRLYNYYAVATSLTALVPTFFLLSRRMYVDSTISFLAIGLQSYVVMLVRSEVVKLEEIELRQNTHEHENLHEEINVPDCVTLL